MKRWLILILLLLPLFWGSWNMNRTLTDMPLNRKERLSSVITSKEVRPFLLGYHTVVADYIWIRTMIYFGGNYGGDMEYLEELVNSVIALNPRFYPPYEFAGVILPDVTDGYDYPRTVLSHGINRVSENSERLAFYLAYINYKHLDDRERAADLMSYASTADFAPPFWRNFAVSLYDEVDKRDFGLQFLIQMYTSAESPQVKEQIVTKIEDLTEMSFDTFLEQYQIQ